MRIRDSYTLDAPPQQVWPHIFQPESLMQLIPGCQEIERITLNEYRSRIHLGIPAISGTYQATVRLSEYQEPSHCSFIGEISGSTGTISGTASFVLKEVNGNRTIIEYEAAAIIGGALGRLKSRFVEGVAQTLVKQGLKNLNKRLQDDLESRPYANC